MSSIRLFILASFAELGPMHGHRLRLEAENKHVPLWTDISVGAVYGAMKRLADEGLLREAYREQDGSRPMRQVYQITEAGLAALSALRRSGLEEVWFKYDPFDLALTRTDNQTLAALPSILASRLVRVTDLLARVRALNDGVRPNVGWAKQWALKHSEYRLEAEVGYLTDLLAAATEAATAALTDRSP